MSTHSNRYRDRDPLHPITKESTKTDIEGMQTAFRLEHNHSQFQGCGGLQTLKDLHGTPTTREHELGMVRVKATEWVNGLMTTGVPKKVVYLSIGKYTKGVLAAITSKYPCPPLMQGGWVGNVYTGDNNRAHRALPGTETPVISQETFHGRNALCQINK